MSKPTFIVCIKAVPDPEGPGSSYEINSESKKVVTVGIPPVLNPYDQNALELALTLREKTGGRVIAINLSEKAVVPVLKKALSVGADELILLEDPLFANLTSYSTASVLAKAIKRVDSFDLVFTGRQAADWDSGQVGLLVAEMLKIPGISLARKASIKDGRITVERLKRTGYEVVRVPVPALITVSSEAGSLRLPTLKAIQDAKKKPVTVWRAEDLEMPPVFPRTRIRSLTPPAKQKRNCVVIEGANAEEKALNLTLRLRQDGVI